MPSTKDLRKRIGSVKSTQQTTKAMKMVSAAKLRRAQEAIINHRPYARRIDNLIKFLSAMPNVGLESPLIHKEQSNGLHDGAAVGSGGSKKKVFLVFVTSDRGLCGAFNGNVIKAGQKWILANKELYDVELGFVGKKAYDFFRKRKFKMGPYYSDICGKMNFAKARKLSNQLINKFISEDVDEIKIIYNEFKNAMSQKVVVDDFLPLQGGGGSSSAVSTEAKPINQEALSVTAEIFVYKPSPAGVLAQLLEKNFSIQAFRILLESQAAEHGARMSSMENATKNAEEMIRKLTLLYNKLRQAGITKELLEIIAGAESQKAS